MLRLLLLPALLVIAPLGHALESADSLRQAIKDGIGPQKIAKASTDPATREFLLETLNHDDPKVVAAAIRSLMAHHDEAYQAASSPIRNLLHHSHPAVAQASRAYAINSRDTNALAPLISSLEEGKQPPAIQTMTIAALEAISGTRQPSPQAWAQWYTTTWQPADEHINNDVRDHLMTCRGSDAIMIINQLLMHNGHATTIRFLLEDVAYDHEDANVRSAARNALYHVSASKSGLPLPDTSTSSTSQVSNAGSGTTITTPVIDTQTRSASASTTTTTADDDSSSSSWITAVIILLAGAAVVFAAIRRSAPLAVAARKRQQRSTRVVSKGDSANKKTARITFSN
ncbi:MAG: HEAT repeat domain-containing protein [Planctomycetota bacterium]|jgi:hypothetical protein